MTGETASALASILVVEDSRTQAEQLKYILEGAGYHTDQTRNGREALDRLATLAPALILSDIMMPEMDGYELCRRCKTDPKRSAVPFVLLTSLSDPEDVIRGLECGADDFVVKPYDENHLLSRVRFNLRSRPEPLSQNQPVEIMFRGRTYSIAANRLQILNLLLSTYEAAVQKNGELVRARDDLREMNARLLLLQRVTAALSEAITQEQAVSIIVEQSAATFGARGGTVGLLDASGETIELVKALGESLEELGPSKVLPVTAPTPLARAVRTGQPVWDASLEEVRAYNPALPSGMPRETTSVAAIPLTVEGRAIGALGLGFDRPRPFGPADRALALALAQQCAQALERSRLFESERCARQSAEVAMRQRDQFISIASHELRTPLTSLRGYSELLVQRVEEEGLDERLLRMAGAIHQQAARLEKMIALLLDITRLENGQFLLERAPLDLKPLIASIVAEFEPTLRKHTLSYDSPANGVRVVGDQVRLEQVMHNLIQNAIKYSPLGGDITVRLEQQDSQARISVSDSGIGIPEEARDRLFARFYRAPNAETYHITGFGVGLYVVREIVRLHGGDIAVQSEEGKGTTFNVRLPLAASPE